MLPLATLFYSFFHAGSTDTKVGSGVFTMTFSSADTAYINLCYIEWPSSAGSFLQSPCLFHPYPYNFTIIPGYPTKVGRPLRDMHSDHITVNINVTDRSGGYRDSILERFLVDGSLPSRTVTTMTEFLKIEFDIACDQNYFGLRCSRFCKTLADGNTNFTCSENGEKICRPGWAGENCSRIEEDGGGNLVISRLVGGKHKSHVFPSMKQHTGKQIFVLSAAIFFTIFIGFTLYLLNAKRVTHVRPSHNSFRIEG